MNRKADELDMTSTRFVDSTGLSSENVSTAEDLAKMVTAAYRYPLIQQYTTLTDHAVALNNGRLLSYHNSNGLVETFNGRSTSRKQATYPKRAAVSSCKRGLQTKPFVIVLLDSWGRYTRIADANRVKKWLESQIARQPAG